MGGVEHAGLLGVSHSVVVIGEFEVSLFGHQAPLNKN